MFDSSELLSLPQVLNGVSAQLVATLQDVRRLEVFCLRASAGKNALQLQDFDKIVQVLAQLAQCCDQLSHESSVQNVEVQRSVVDRLMLAELRKRLRAESIQVSSTSGDVEFF